MEWLVEKVQPGLHLQTDMAGAGETLCRRTDAAHPRNEHGTGGQLLAAAPAAPLR